MKIAIVYSSFYGNFEEELLRNALFFFPNLPLTPNEFSEIQKKDFVQNILPHNFNSIYSEVAIAKVSGAMEIPQAIKWLLEKKQYSGILALGCIIQGETSHFDHVCHTAMRGISKLALKSSTPIANGIVTAYTEKDVVERISSNGKNLGLKAMQTLDSMIHLKNKISYDHS